METEWAVLGRFLCRRRKNSYRLGQVQTPQTKRIEKNWKKRPMKIRTLQCWTKNKTTTFYIPSRELTYPPQNGILKMIFLFPRWDMLIPWRVNNTHLPIHFRGLFLRWLISGLLKSLSQLGVGDGFKHFSCSSLNMGKSSNLTNFQMGWNHQLVGYQKRSRLESLGMFSGSGSGAFVRGNPGRGIPPAVPQLSNENRKLGCLGYIGDEILPNYIGIIISDYKGPY